MLASDWDELKAAAHFAKGGKFLIEPKIDGVRGLNAEGTLTGRSLKKFANRHTTAYYSNPYVQGFDGEFAAEHECHPDLCRLTTSALTTIGGAPYLLWHVFDYITPSTVSLPYCERLLHLGERVAYLKQDPDLMDLMAHIRLVPARLVASMEELLAADEEHLDLGYEGSILRDPFGLHKQGRSTVREGGLLRIKRFVDFEFVITGLVEGEKNGNEAQTNELGLQFRSSHQENMIPNGMVGALLGTVLKDVFDLSGNKVMSEGDSVKVGAGCMPHDDRLRYFQNPALILGEIGKAKMFPKGIKDKPRFPTFQTLRSLADM